MIQTNEDMVTNEKNTNSFELTSDDLHNAQEVFSVLGFRGLSEPEEVIDAVNLEEVMLNNHEDDTLLSQDEPIHHEGLQLPEKDASPEKNSETGCKSPEKSPTESFSSGQYVAVIYDRKWYVTKVLSIRPNDEIELSFMKQQVN